jgi:nucleotide-binding universal stress UspA family protein
MFDNALVGVDGHEGGRDAIALGGVLVTEGAKLTLAHVSRGDPHRWRGSSATFEAGDEERARELLGGAARDAGVEAQMCSHSATSVGGGLHDLAKTIGADLIVVGSSRRGLLGRVLLADDTRAALNGAPCAVAVAPAGYAREAAVIRTIGVGYNGSPESVHALNVARSLAASHRAKLVALETVAAPAYVLAAGPTGPEDALASLLEEANSELAALNDVAAHASYGRPADEAGNFSSSVDLLVVGSRTYGPVGRLVHGSTSRQLARAARCPLLILTGAARAAEAASGSSDGQAAAATRGQTWPF